MKFKDAYGMIMSESIFKPTSSEEASSRHAEHMEDDNLFAFSEHIKNLNFIRGLDYIHVIAYMTADSEPEKADVVAGRTSILKDKIYAVANFIHEGHFLEDNDVITDMEFPPGRYVELNKKYGLQMDDSELLKYRYRIYIHDFIEHDPDEKCRWGYIVPVSGEGNIWKLYRQYEI
jgi:hypothetical protein